jgi:hypothetical protein
MTNFLTDRSGKHYSHQYPQPTTDMLNSGTVSAVSGETVAFKAGAAGFRGIVRLASNKVLNQVGDKIGSYFKKQENLVVQGGVEGGKVTALTETATAADITITDTINNLEDLFEVTTGNSSHVLVAIDPSGNELYGWIRGVAKTGNSYVLNITNVPAGTTQSWVGDLTAFVSTTIAGCTYQIYSYESSLLWVTGTILLKEVLYNSSKSDYENLLALTTNGDYAVDYAGGRVFYRKATTGTSDTVGYNYRAAAGGGGAVTNAGTFVVQEDGAALTALQLIDNPVAVLGTDVYAEATSSGMVIGAVRRDADTTLVDTTNEIAPLQVDANGRLKVEAFSGETLPVSAATMEASLSVMDDWDNTASDGASVSGDVAHDGVDAGEPVKMGGKALTAEPTAVAANDRVNAMYDIYGHQITRGALREMKGAQTTTITSSTAETTVVTADATYKLDVYGIIVTNTSATATEVTFKDSTAGTSRFMISVPANDMRGFMLPIDSGHLQNAANNNWTGTCADSVASVVITVLFVKNL